MVTRRSITKGAAISVAAALLLSACSAGGAGADADGGGDITWYMWTGSQPEIDAWTHISEMVTEAYPEVSVTFETASFGDYFTKLAAQSSSGEAACVVGMQSLFLPGFKDALTPLAELEEFGIDLSEFDESIAQGMNLEGEQYAIPYDFGPANVYYNKTMFEDKGVPLPTPEWTTEDFLAAAKSLTGDGTYGFGALPYPDFVVPFQLSEYGSRFIAEDGGLKMTEPDFESTMQWYVDLVRKEKVAPEVPATSDVNWAVNQFQNGRVAMVLDGPWDLINLKTTSDFELGIAQIPAGAAGSQTSAHGSGFGISSSCKNREAALKALSVITGPEAAEYLAEEGRAFPARTAQQSTWFETADMPGAEDVLRATLETASPARATENWPEFTQAFLQYGVQVMNGEMTVSEFAKTVEQQVG